MWNIGRQMASMFGGIAGELGGQFKKEYACYPVSFAGKDDMEKGNKILLPQSALHQLARMNITWPMLFEMSNPRADRMTHSGVLEFVAEEGTCYMPYWMMQNLLLKEGDVVEVSNISLPKGEYVKLQPVTKDFLDVSNPRAVLENALRNYATLTVGDNVIIQYMDKTYEIEVVELKPAPAVSIIETDIQVDFQLKEEPEPPACNTYSEGTEQGAFSGDTSSNTYISPIEASTLFQGAGMRLDGKVSRNSPMPSGANTAASSATLNPSHKPPRKLSNQSDTSRRTSTQGVTLPDDEEPWRSKLPGGVRTFDTEYNAMVREGRIPGVIGKVKTRGIAAADAPINSSSSSDGARSINRQPNSSNTIPAVAVHSSSGIVDPNFKLFGGRGNRF